MEANAVRNVTLVNAAVGSSPGTIHFVEKAWSVNSHMVEEKTDQTVDIPCTILDSESGRLGDKPSRYPKDRYRRSQLAVLSGAVEILPCVLRVVVDLHKNADKERYLIG